MTNENREKLIQETEQKCLQIRQSKGVDYSGLEDVNSNFKRVAQAIGVTPEQALWVYYLKHHDALNTYIKNGELTQKTESAEDKIIDNINYLHILLSLIYEKKENRTYLA